MESILSTIPSQCSGTLTGPSAQVFLTLLQTLVSAQCSLKQPQIKDYGPELHDMDIFDFVVIGAGSAGSVVANRLSEVPDWNVLLLEAGDIPSVSTQIPALLFSNLNSSDTWQHDVTSQDFNCRAMKGKKCKFITGKALGGSSSVNAMLYVRGNRMDYDNWEAQGNTGWGFENVLEYFKKSEDNQEHLDNEEMHGTGGYQKVGNIDLHLPIKKILQESIEELEIPFVRDIHNNTDICFGNAQGTVHEGKRHSTYHGFIHSVKDRDNLKIVTKAEVTKILINETTNEAMAVEYRLNGEIKRVRITKEVIISAGALKTPQILMLSGIGPKKHLEELGIKVIKDLKVGQNLQDHVLTLGVTIKIPNELVTDSLPIDHIYEYFMYRKGPLASISLTNFMGFINTLKNSEYPDVQIYFFNYVQNDKAFLPGVIHTLGIGTEMADQLNELNKESAILQIIPALLRPKSRGAVKLKSMNPFDMPTVIHNYLKEEEDLETLLRGVEFALDVLNTKSFQKYNPELVKLNICDNYEYMSKDYWRCTIRGLISTIYHYSGTAKMGPDSDPDAVVDPRLRVKGIKKLRVVDASIMPNLVSANTNAACIMIGEKGADMIKEDWNIIVKKQNDEL